MRLRSPVWALVGIAPVTVATYAILTYWID